MNLRGKTAIIIASGPSAIHAPIHLARGYPCIAVNNSWRLAPWANALYGADGAWWRSANTDGFAGLKITADRHAARDLGLMHVEVDASSNDLTFDGPIGGGGMSGFQALTLAARWQAKRIVLVGFDLLGAHWHGDHAPPLRNPSVTVMARCLKALTNAAPVLAAHGIEVINASDQSALRCWPVMSLADALGRDVAPCG